MLDLVNIVNVLVIRAKNALNSIDLTSLKFYLNLFTSVISIMFLTLTTSFLIQIDTGYFLAVIVVLPFLLNVSLGNSLNKLEYGKLIVWGNFIKNTAVKHIEKALYLLIDELFFMPRNWVGVFIIFALWVLFMRANPVILFVAIFFFLTTSIAISFLQGLVLYMQATQMVVLKVTAFFIKLILSLLPLGIFTLLYQFFYQPSGSYLQFILNPLYISTSNTNYLIFLFISIVLFVVITLIYFVQSFLLTKYFYFHERNDDSNKKIHITKDSPRLSIKLPGIFLKNIRWLSRFPGVIFNVFYPLVFVVLGTLLFFSYSGIDSLFFRVIYLTLAVSNIRALTDNQLSIFGEYFLFDLTHKIKIYHYFVSNLILSLVAYFFIMLLLSVANQTLGLGFDLTLTVLASLLLFVVGLNIKGIFVSLIDYKPGSYIGNDIKMASEGCVSSIIHLFFNFLFILPVYFLILFNVPFQFILIVIIAALLFFILLLLGITYFFDTYFYYRLVDRISLEPGIKE